MEEREEDAGRDYRPVCLYLPSSNTDGAAFHTPQVSALQTTGEGRRCGITNDLHPEPNTKRLHFLELITKRGWFITDTSFMLSKNKQ